MNDNRIRIIDATDANQSTFVGFVKNIMPDLYEEEEQAIVLKTINESDGKGNIDEKV